MKQIYEPKSFSDISETEIFKLCQIYPCLSSILGSYYSKAYNDDKLAEIYIQRYEKLKVLNEKQVVRPILISIFDLNEKRLVSKNIDMINHQKSIKDLEREGYSNNNMSRKNVLKKNKYCFNPD